MGSGVAALRSVRRGAKDSKPSDESKLDEGDTGDVGSSSCSSGVEIATSPGGEREEDDFSWLPGGVSEHAPEEVSPDAYPRSPNIEEPARWMQNNVVEEQSGRSNDRTVLMSALKSSERGALDERCDGDRTIKPQWGGRSCDVDSVVDAAKTRRRPGQSNRFSEGRSQEVDSYKDFVQYQLYHRPDPFALLSNDWLEGIAPKEDEREDGLPMADPTMDEDIIESPQDIAAREAKEEESRQVEARREAEVLRMEELVNDVGDGWKLWLRGRDLRSEFKVQPTLSKAEEKLQEFKAQEKVQGHRARTVGLPPYGKPWFRVPVDAREPKAEMVCWRGDFVKEAVTDANLLGMERPTIASETMRECARRDWNVIDQFYWYVEAVDLDGNRELWSPTFVGYLWEYWQRSDLGNLVCLSEVELEAKAQKQGLRGLLPEGLSNGLFLRKPVEWPKPVWKPPQMKVPPEVFHILDQPDLPPFPGRFPHRLFFQDGPLEKQLAKQLQGTEAWDALVGTSDRLQAAGRAVLRSEKLEEIKACKRAQEEQLRDEERARQEELERTLRKNNDDAKEMSNDGEAVPWDESGDGRGPAVDHMIDDTSVEDQPEEVIPEEVNPEEAKLAEDIPPAAVPKKGFRTSKLESVEELRKAKVKPKAKKKDAGASERAASPADAKAKAAPKATGKKKPPAWAAKGGGMAAGGNKNMMMMRR